MSPEHQLFASYYEIVFELAESITEAIFHQQISKPSDLELSAKFNTSMLIVMAFVGSEISTLESIHCVCVAFIQSYTVLYLQQLLIHSFRKSTESVATLILKKQT